MKTIVNYIKCCVVNNMAGLMLNTVELLITAVFLTDYIPGAGLCS